MITPIIMRAGANGVVANTSQLFLPRIESYTHTISATGGFESCEITFQCPPTEALIWLTNLGANVVCYGPDATVCWDGKLTDVEVQIGGEKATAGLASMHNAVQVLYNEPWGFATSTTVATNSSSIGNYGRKELVYSASSMTLAAAELLRNTYLGSQAFPTAVRSSRIGGTQNNSVGRVTLRFSGWYYLLDWIYTSNPSTALVNRATQLSQIVIGTYQAINPFFSGIDTVTLTDDTAFIPPNTTCRAAVERKLATGLGTDNQLAWGVYEDRLFRVRVWAGAGIPTLSNVTYIQRLGGNRITTPQGQIISPWLVRPDTVYQVVDFVPTTTIFNPNRIAQYYVQRVTYSVDASGESLTLEPEQSQDIATLLAKIIY